MSNGRFEVEFRPWQSRYVLLDRGESGERGEPGEPSEAGIEVGEEAFVDVAAVGDGAAPERVFFHTSVSDAYAGRGLASVLVRGALDDAVSSGYRIVPVCPYVAAWLKKYPEYERYAIRPRPAHLEAVRAQRAGR